MQDHKPDPEQLSELYQLRREYESALFMASDPEEQRRLRQIIRELEACILQIEDGRSA